MIHVDACLTVSTSLKPRTSDVLSYGSCVWVGVEKLRYEQQNTELQITIIEPVPSPSYLRQKFDLVCLVCPASKRGDGARKYKARPTPKLSALFQE